MVSPQNGKKEIVGREKSATTVSPVNLAEDEGGIEVKKKEINEDNSYVSSESTSGGSSSGKNKLLALAGGKGGRKDTCKHVL